MANEGEVGANGTDLPALDLGDRRLQRRGAEGDLGPVRLAPCTELWQRFRDGNLADTRRADLQIVHDLGDFGDDDRARRHGAQPIAGHAETLREGISWHQFLKKGYYVIPPLPENRRDPLALNWFARGVKKDTPELAPLPSEFYGRYNEGLQTPSGKFEFEAQTLLRFDPDDQERLPICTYIPSWEGVGSEPYEKYKLQLVSPHSKFSFHTMGDGKDSFINDIEQHRMLIDGYYYWILRLNPGDAAQRGLAHGDIVEVYNDRGSVLCGLETTGRIPTGVAHSYEACADYRPIGEPGASPEKNGCINTLTPKRFITKNAHGLAVGSCLVEVRKWEGGRG